MPLLKDRFRGSMFGLAIGDAMGAPIEFNLPGSFERVGDLTGGGYFKLKPGEWTDDTSLSLCVVESLIRCKEFDPIDQLNTFLTWYRKGHLSARREAFGVGLVTASALMRFESTHEPFCGPTGPKTAANGSLMHIAPVPLAYFRNPAKGIKIAEECSRLTHGARESIDACRYMSALIIGALNGYDKEKLLLPSFDIIVPETWKSVPLTGRIRRIAEGAFKSKTLPRITSENYSDAAIALNAALWAFYSTDDFASGLLKVVNLGWDADTMGAVYGQLAGAYYGYRAIPKQWRNKIAKHALIERMTEGIYKFSGDIK